MSNSSRKSSLEAGVERTQEVQQNFSNEDQELPLESDNADPLQLEKRLSRDLADSHDNILSIGKLIAVLLSLSLSIFLSFVDQTAIPNLLPSIADDLNAHSTISWAGTSLYISNTVFMVLFGRFSDIFSRKYVLLFSLVILGFMELACGFAQTPYQFYLFRGLCGVGAGGVNSLTNTIVSDVVTLKERGKYQGVLGLFVGLGNALGPFLASAFVMHLSWRKFFWALCPLILCSACIVYAFVPYTHTGYNFKLKLLQVDYPGFFTSAVAIIFTLIPLSGGGSSFEWNSAFSISFFCIGGVFFVLFILNEKFVAKLPLLPLHLFQTNISLTALLSQNFFLGTSYFSTLYYTPYYLQVVRGFSILRSAEFMLSFVIIQATCSVISGQIVSRTGHYLHVIWFGYIFWAVGTSLCFLWHTDTKNGVIIGTNLVQGIGIGSIFQTTIVAAQAQSYKKDRAVIISTRNFLRFLGAAVGLAICSTILSNSYLKILRKDGSNVGLTQTEIASLGKLVYSQDISLTGYTTDQVKFLKIAYMTSLRHVYSFIVASAGCCLLSTSFVRDNGVQPLDVPREK